MKVLISVTGGAYEGGGRYEGELSGAPVTTLVPEGIVSARTTAEAERVRGAIARTLATESRMRMSSTSWEITAERLDDDATAEVR